MSPDLHRWARETVLQWVAAIDDVPTLQAWHYACRVRLAALGVSRRDIALEVGKDLYSNGAAYVITGVVRTVEDIEITNLGEAPRHESVERITVELRRTVPQGSEGP
jgi:hypothetical protein